MEKSTERTPTKDQPKSLYNTPEKEIAKQSPSKTSDLNNLQMTVESFANQIDTQLRATLYSVSSENMEEVNKTMLSMRETVKDFQKNAQSALRETRIRWSEEIQDKYLLTLEKNELLERVKVLEEELEALKFSKEVPDKSSLENAFKDSDASFDTDGCDPKKKAKLDIS